MKNLNTLFKNSTRKELFAGLAYRLLLGWLLASVFFMIINDFPFTSFQFFSRINLGLFLGSVLLIWLLLCFLPNKAVTVLMLITALTYGVIGAVCYNNFVFSLGLSATVGLIILHSRLDFSVKLHPNVPWIIAGALLILFTLFVGIICCLKYKNHWTSCFDFGIFSQMFHYMKETGLPLTTCERDGLLTHFAVHFSPVFYLLLPFYIIFPDPCTLQIAQAFVVASGIIPMLLICKNHKLSNSACILFSACYILYPCFAGGCFFYIHENNFLLPLILWFLFFSEREKLIPSIISAGLILLVKEDAPVYVAVAALYFLFTSKKYKRNTLLLLFSIVYFVLVTHFLQKYGDGVMTHRFSNYMYDGNSSLVTMVKAILMNPIYVLQQIFTQEKLIFLLQMLAPLGFLPLITKNPKRLILLIPFLMFNLITDYPYMFDVNYQYCFGSGAFLIYLAIVNYSELADGRKLLLTAACCSLIVFMGLHFGRAGYLENYKYDAKQRQTIDYALGLIPEDASVVSSTFLLPNLSQRDELYQLETTSRSAEYYVLDLRYSTNKYSVEDYLGEGFETLFYEEGIIAVFKRVGDFR